MDECTFIFYFSFTAYYEVKRNYAYVGSVKEKNIEAAFLRCSTKQVLLNISQN